MKTWHDRLADGHTLLWRCVAPSKKREIRQTWHDRPTGRPHGDARYIHMKTTINYSIPVALLQFSHGSSELHFEVNFAVVLTDNFEANIFRGFVTSVLVGAVVTHRF